MAKKKDPAKEPASKGADEAEKTNSAPLLPFKAVWTKLKAVDPFLSFEGKSTRGEYWATRILLGLPIGFLLGLSHIIGVYSDYGFTHRVCFGLEAVCSGALLLFCSDFRCRSEG